MKIGITGGNGYIGSKLKLALEKNGHEVESFDLPKNILNADELRSFIKGKDKVFHLAALAELIYTDAHPQETFEVNIIGTNNVARICAEENVLLNFTSTCCIYGDPIETPSTERGQINPTDTYAMSKASGEYLVKMWGLAKGLKYNIMRFGTVYGPSLKKEMRNDMCIQKFLNSAIKHEKLTIDGSGTQKRNFVYIDDLVRGLVLLAESEVVKEIINFAGDEKISVSDIAFYAIDFGADGIEHAEKRKDDFSYQDISNKKAYNLLGWTPEISFEEGMKEFYYWLIEQKCSR